MLIFILSFLRLNEEFSIRRVTIMVILNLSLCLILKSFRIIPSLYDLVMLIQYFKKSKNGTFITDSIFLEIRLCYLDSFCVLIEHLANFLYFLSVSILLLFYFNFDKKFSSSFNK